MSEPLKLNPEVKWKTVVSLYFNYITTIHKVLDKEFGQEQSTKIVNQLTAEFWKEQAQALIELFNLKPGILADAHSLKRILAAVLDIGYMNIQEDEHEIVDGIKVTFCPIKVILEPIWPKICDFCEPWGQIMIDQLDPNFKHKVVRSTTICKHITTKKS